MAGDVDARALGELEGNPLPSDDIELSVLRTRELGDRRLTVLAGYVCLRPSTTE